MTVSVGILFVARYLGETSDETGQLIMLGAAVGSVLFPLTLFRFVTVTAAQGVEMDDVTFLFTDLQDSTLMYERIGNATAYDLVRDHFKVLEAATRSHGGVIVKTIGDAIMARFRIQAQAVRTAIDMRERIEHLAEQGTADLVLRIGLHRGPAIAVVARDRVDYFGQTVNAASRIQAAALPGEIVLSDDVYRGLGVAELLVGYDLISERRKLRGVTTEMLLHRVAAGTPAPLVEGPSRAWPGRWRAVGPRRRRRFRRQPPTRLRWPGAAERRVLEACDPMGEFAGRVPVCTLISWDARRA